MNLDQFNSDVTKATSAINTVASSAMAVENMAATAVAAGAASLTGAQKLQIATGIATALDPALAPLGPALNALFAAVVTGWHLAGVFTSSNAAPTATSATSAAAVTPANYTSAS